MVGAHQANLRIISATGDRMGLDPSKVMVNIQKYGNTTSATIPLCLYEWENQLHKGDNLILAAFGAGFTWGAIWLKWAYDPKSKVGKRIWKTGLNFQAGFFIAKEFIKSIIKTF